MKNISLILIFITGLSFTTKSISQNLSLIEGKVTDAKTNEPLSFVSVYLSQTSIGIATDKNGNYRINKIPPGKYTLVISQIGYEPILKKIEIVPESKNQKNFYLKSKPIEMNTITVNEQSDEYAAYLREQKNYRELFKKYFLGQTNFSKECIIENIGDIIFTKKNDLYLEAKCTKPVVVINKALGYKIECLLIHFQCNDTKGYVSDEFYPTFSELYPENVNQIKQWDENRKSAYQSSLRRFLLSVIYPNITKTDYGLYIPPGRFDIKSLPKSRLLYGEENIAHYDSTSMQHYLGFKGFLLVHNFLTQEQSWVFLPFGTAYIGLDGYPIDPMSILVFNTFALHGVANLLPIDLLIKE